MRIFKETQSSRQWWLILIAGMGILLIIAGYFLDKNELSPTIFPFVDLLPVLFLFGFIFLLRLKINIDHMGFMQVSNLFHTSALSIAGMTLKIVMLGSMHQLRNIAAGALEVSILLWPVVFQANGNTNCSHDDTRFFIGTQKTGGSQEIN